LLQYFGTGLTGYDILRILLNNDLWRTHNHQVVLTGLSGDPVIPRSPYILKHRREKTEKEILHKSIFELKNYRTTKRATYTK
jgi:hypothetical protein